tara:strand:+ start:552 stop:1079 length:528 start_codon:yes stop_codon:yes gene_type:complete
MSVKLLLLKSGEEVITEVQEIVDPNSKDPVGFKLHKPFRLDIVSDDGGIVFNREKGYQVSWFPWAPLSKDRDFFLPGHHVLTAYDPLDSLTEQYVQAIKADVYDENFKKHEAAMSGITDGDLDMEQLFADAEKLLEDEDGSDGSDTEVGDAPDLEGGADGRGTELPPTGSVSDQG